MTSPDLQASGRLANRPQVPPGPASASAATAGTKHGVSGGPVHATLPDRNVTSETLEDAYMNFIFYCNPALPLDADTEALREAFRNPPKSGGKSFDTFAIYELVKKFYGKDIKTWTELTIQLGVEPPDPSKDESSQKVTQYGVRLKKWMNSLHVKSFFEYLMDISNDYWTIIPNDPDPTSQGIRDGVALEDDMALRALIPHIRPKRGRKRPEDADAATPAAQRMRLSPSSAIDAVPPAAVMPWSRDSHLSAAPLGFPRSAHPGSGPNEGPETPFSQWPTSAITPTIRGSFWDDTLEPQSAITPTSKLGRQRRGAKNVSSAWKLGGLEGSSGKTRGRPPINRTPIDGPNNPWSVPGVRLNPALSTPVEQLANQSNTPTSTPTPPTNSNLAQPRHTHVPAPPVPTRTTSAPAVPVVPQAHPLSAGSANKNNPRPARPSISLQVPKRAGGPVRLATPPPPPPPPPVVMVNGQETADEAANPAPVPGAAAGIGFMDRWHDFAKEATNKYEFSPNLPLGGSIDASNTGPYYFEKIEDRTNVDSLLNYFVQTAHEAQWLDEQGNPDEPASMDEAAALVNATLENMLKTSTSSQAFLINLAALAGARTLLATTARCYRLADEDEFYNYRLEWEYRFGHFKGHFNMTQTVPRSMWTKPSKDNMTAGNTTDGGGSSGLSAEDWQRKYVVLLDEMKRRDEELIDLRAKMMTSKQRERS